MYFLADKKRASIEEIESMTVEEFNHWMAYYQLQYEAEKKAIEEAKKGRK